MAEEFQIPAGAAKWSQRVTLDGVTYFVALEWNQRVDRWFFSLSDSLQQPILSGRKVLPNRNLLQAVASGKGPPGILMAVDWTSSGLVPDLANFDGAVTSLVYVPIDEVPS